MFKRPNLTRTFEQSPFGKVVLFCHIFSLAHGFHSASCSGTSHLGFYFHSRCEIM